MVTSNGCDTPQVYIGYPGAKASSILPTKVLRGFQKVCGDGANTNRMTTVRMTLSDRDVSEWDITSKTWNVVNGVFAVHVGSSSQDIRLTGTLTV